jgi:hypothetical protein
MRETIGKPLSVALGIAMLIAGFLSFRVAATRANKEADQPAAGIGKNLDEVLKDTGLAYAKSTNQQGRSFYRVTVEVGGEVCVVVVSEYPWSWKYKSGATAADVSLYTNIAQLPKDFKPPLAMYKKLTDINDHSALGAVNLVNDNLYFYAQFLRHDLDPETLTFYLTQLAWQRLDARKELLPFLQEGK